MWRILISSAHCCPTWKFNPRSSRRAACTALKPAAAAPGNTRAAGAPILGRFLHIHPQPWGTTLDQGGHETCPFCSVWQNRSTTDTVAGEMKDTAPPVPLLAPHHSWHPAGWCLNLPPALCRSHCSASRGSQGTPGAHSTGKRLVNSQAGTKGRVCTMQSYAGQV